MVHHPHVSQEVIKREYFMSPGSEEAEKGYEIVMGGP